MVASASLLGTAALTLLVGFVAPRYDLRSLFLIGAGLATATGLVFPMVEAVVPVLVVAFMGTINPSAGDLGMLIPLEHALLTQETSDHNRTGVFARYGLIGSLTAAAGSLAAALPEFMTGKGMPEVSALRLMFYGYAALGLSAAILYSRLPRDHMRAATRPRQALGQSRKIVYKLAALFSLDAFAGGFVVQSWWHFGCFSGSFVALLGRRGRLFFWTGLSERRSYRLPRAWPDDRARQHDGVHPYPVEPVPRRDPVLPQASASYSHSCSSGRRCRKWMCRPDQSYVMADCPTRRSAPLRRASRGAPQPCFFHQPRDCRLHAPRGRFRHCRWWCADA